MTIPIVGMGGVQSGAHAADLLAAGASLVAVGTESFRDPRAGARVAAELARPPGIVSGDGSETRFYETPQTGVT